MKVVQQTFTRLQFVLGTYCKTVSCSWSRRFYREISLLETVRNNKKIHNTVPIISLVLRFIVNQKKTLKNELDHFEFESPLKS